VGRVTRISWLFFVLFELPLQAFVPPAQPYPELLFFLPMVVDQQACLGSIIAGAAERCIPWTQREVAGPLYLKSRQEIIIGGKSGYLQAFDLNTRTTARLKKLQGNLIAKALEHEGTLYFGLDSGVVQAVDVATFKPLWQLSLDGGVSAPPVIYKDKLIVASDAASIYALDLQKGTILWVARRPYQRNISLPYFGAPLIFEMREGAAPAHFVVYGHPSGRVDFIDVNTGKIEFNVQIGIADQSFSDVVAAPILFNGAIIAAGFNSGIVAFDPFSKTKLWTIAEKGISRLAVVDKQIIATGPKKVIGLSGQKIRWRFEFDRGEPTSLVINRDLIYFGADGNGFFALNRFSGKPLKYLGSRVGFSGELEWSKEDDLLFATSTAGFLYVMSTRFNGNVQQKAEIASKKN